MIDTLKFARTLRERGMAEGQADALAEAVNEALSDYSATKADLSMLESRLQTSIANARNLQMAWTIAAIFGLGVFQHYFH